MASDRLAYVTLGAVALLSAWTVSRVLDYGADRADGLAFVEASKAHQSRAREAEVASAMRATAWFPSRCMVAPVDARCPVNRAAVRPGDDVGAAIYDLQSRMIALHCRRDDAGKPAGCP